MVIIFKNDTEENWDFVNPILRESEIIVVTQPLSLGYKLGDGETHYKDLPFCDLEYCLEHGYIYAPTLAPFNKIKLHLTSPSLAQTIEKEK
jgi:hypothetical protein